MTGEGKSLEEIRRQIVAYLQPVRAAEPMKIRFRISDVRFRNTRNRAEHDLARIGWSQAVTVVLAITALLAPVPLTLDGRGAARAHIPISARRFAFEPSRVRVNRGDTGR